MRQILRVLFVSPVSDFKGGAEVVLRNMLHNPRIEVVLATPEPGELSRYASNVGITVCHYWPRAMLNIHRPLRPSAVVAGLVDALRCCRRIRKLSNEHGCNIIHSNGLKAHILCSMLAPFSKAAVLIHLHDIPNTVPEKIIWRLIARLVDQVVLVSRACFPGATLPVNVRVLRNGIDLKGLVQGNTGSNITSIRLGFIGRFHPTKGLDRVVDWFKAVRAANIEATLVIRGRPDPLHLVYWERICARLASPDISEFVQLDGWKTGEAVYEGLDFVLLTSELPDPAPLVILEAMRARVIVVAYPTGGIPEMITDGENGILVCEAGEFAVTLKSLWQDMSAQENIRNVALSRLSAMNSLETFLDSLNGLYSSITLETCPASLQVEALIGNRLSVKAKDLSKQS